MLFNSFQFLLFFPLVVTIYFLTPHRFRWLWLLASSYYFYMCWKAEYIILILASTVVDYFVALQLGKSRSVANKKTLLLISICVNLGILFAFKYFNFFNDSMRLAFNRMNVFYNIPAFQALLPVGISFYTFQTLAYTIDVYRGKIKPEKHFGIFALYVAFFPQLVAGPIERAYNLMPQFYQKIQFNYERVTDGLKLMLWGFFKKLVIADRLAVLVDQVYNHPTEYTGIPLIIATYCFAFQIFCDFSGYSDIAIGAARVMGINLMQNFNAPYWSRTIREFWKRWHISLSTWFKDYLYIPLGGNRVSQLRWYYNIMAVFLLSGLWHGADWTFIVWGALHGSYMLFAIWTSRLRAKLNTFFRLHQIPKMHNLIRTLTTFHLVVFAWIFFRAQSISDAFYIVSHLFKGIEWKLSGNRLGLTKTEMAIAFLAILLMEAVHFMQNRISIKSFLSSKPTWFRWGAYAIPLWAILCWGKTDAKIFIYFVF